METTEVNIKNWKSLIKPAKLDISLSEDKTFIPNSSALEAAASAAICAAYGVDFLDPLKPFCPADAHDITFPLVSAIEIIVLLNVD